MLLDGELRPDEESAIETHLATCQHCREELAALKNTDAALRALDTMEPSPFFESRVFNAVRAQTAKPQRLLWLPLGATAAMLIFIMANAAVFAASLPPEMRGEIAKKAATQLASPDSIMNPVALAKFCYGCEHYMCDCLTRAGRPHICMCKDCKMKKMIMENNNGK